MKFCEHSEGSPLFLSTGMKCSTLLLCYWHILSTGMITIIGTFYDLGKSGDTT